MLQQAFDPSLYVAHYSNSLRAYPIFFVWFLLRLACRFEMEIAKFLYCHFSSDSTVSHLIIQKMEAILNWACSLSLITDGCIRGTGHFSNMDLSSQKMEYSDDAPGMCCSSTFYKCWKDLKNFDRWSRANQVMSTCLCPLPLQQIILKVQRGWKLLNTLKHILLQERKFHGISFFRTSSVCSICCHWLKFHAKLPAHPHFLFRASVPTQSNLWWNTGWAFWYKSILLEIAWVKPEFSELILSSITRNN